MYMKLATYPCLPRLSNSLKESLGSYLSETPLINLDQLSLVKYILQGVHHQILQNCFPYSPHNSC